MKIAVFAAVPEEVGKLSDIVNFMGIGRENATRTALEFLQKHKDEDFIVLNVGTVGSHAFPVGTILSIDEITSSGMLFCNQPMRLDKLQSTITQDLTNAVLFSSDSFVSPHVYTTEFLSEIKEKAGCFDMESSALYSVMAAYGKKYVSFKIVSDNLDVTIAVWQQRVAELSKKLVAFLEQMFAEIGSTENVEFIVG